LETPARDVAVDRLAREEAIDWPVLGRRMIFAFESICVGFVVALVTVDLLRAVEFEVADAFVVVAVEAGGFTSYF